MSATAPATAPATAMVESKQNSRGLQSAGPSTARKFSNHGKRNFKPTDPKPEPKTLFQQYFKSVGTRTYAAQVKEASNGNHFMVLTEGKRDKKTNELKKLSLFVFSEDFDAFKNLLRDTFKFVSEHPVSPEVAKKQAAYWNKKRNEPRSHEVTKRQS